jgi:hypothetical protein
MSKPCAWDSRPLYEKLIGPLRDVAQRLGYALTVHGTLKRDIDLVAVPWTTAAVSAKVLVRALRARTGELVGWAKPCRSEARSSNPKYHRDGLAGFVRGFGRVLAKPHGRRCWVFYLTPDQPGPYVDLSVMPRRRDEG